MVCCMMLHAVQDDVERQELRVEAALAELSGHRHHDQRRAAAADATSGIDAFEMTLKRLGATGTSTAAGETSVALHHNTAASCSANVLA